MERLVALDDVGHAIGVVPKGQTFGVVDPDLAETLVRSGKARRENVPVLNCRGWDGLVWDGATVVCIASGPTLTVEQCNLVWAWKGRSDRKVIAVNTSCERVPWADVIYGGDDRWWRYHWKRVSQACKGEFFCLDRTLYAEGAGRLRMLKHQALSGLGTKPGVIHQGGNSGYQAVCLAYWAGAAKIVLLGYDCHARGGSHWHGDHPVGMNVRNNYKSWIQAFARLAEDLRAAGVPVFNCSPDSDVKGFDKVGLEQALT